MAVVIIKEPNKVSWCRNPMVYELQSDNRYSTVGRQYKGRLVVSDAVNGNSFTLTWDGVAHNFSFRTIPDDSGLQLSVKKVEQSENDFALSLASELRSYYPLNNDFDISIVTNTITLLAREKGTDLSISYTGNYPGGVWSNLTSGITPVMRDNFALLAEIAVKRENGALESFSKSVIELDEENKAIWDVQEYIAAALYWNGAVRPDLKNQVIWKESKSTIKYVLNIAEMYGSPQTVRKIKQTNEVLAVLGGLSAERMGLIMPDMFMEGSVNKWISHPGVKRVSAKQIDYASIVNWGMDRTGTITIRCRLSYADERVMIGTVGTVVNWKQGEKIVVPCGLDWIASKMGGVQGEVVSVDLWCEMSGVRLSTDYTMRVDSRYHGHLNLLLFQNSLGCWESLYTYGKCEWGYEVVRNGAVFEPIINGSKYDPSRKELDVELQHQIKVNTGYFDKEMIKRFRDFILSGNKYIYKNGWVPVVGTSTSIQEFEDGDYLHGLSFSLEYANEEVLY